MFAKQEYEVEVLPAEQFVQHCRRAWQQACASLLIMMTETTKLVADYKRCPAPTFCTEQQILLTVHITLHSMSHTSDYFFVGSSPPRHVSSPAYTVHRLLDSCRIRVEWD
ncbi:hypothetical protein MHYP_G00111230 [Metynnis hypsauchen]